MSHQSPLWRRDLRVERGAPIALTVDGARVDAFAGESLAIALAAAGLLTLRRSPTVGTGRGVFCLMGVCQECVVPVDGVPTTACLELARDGMVITLAPSSLERSATRGVDP